jgi:hypothetical protein
MDPKKLIDKLPRFDKDKPFRYLGRRVLQAMAEAASANFVIGKRTAPGKYLVVRIVESAVEKESWEQQFAESRAALVKELEREAASRDIQLRSKPELDLLVMTDVEAPREGERAISTVLDDQEVAAAYARLQEEREIILPRRVRTLLLESDPPEAQAYVDHKPVGVTPCRVDDVPDGDHVLTFARPGFLPFEETYRVEPGRPGQRLTFRATLKPEPQMGVLEIKTFPPRARVTVGEETRETPARWRLPAGLVEARVELEEFEPRTFRTELPPTTEERPHRVQLKLKYDGPHRDEIVGRLLIYKPGSYTPRRGDAPRPAPATAPTGSNRISSFFNEVDDLDRTQEWEAPLLTAAPPFEKPEQPEILKEVPLRRGVILIGREDPGSDLVPDLRLFDAENSVSRGCHAWLYVYADISTGATFNTFLIGNNSPAGIRVDGTLVMETRRLSEDSEIEVGNFRMRVVKEIPEPRVEIDF